MSSEPGQQTLIGGNESLLAEYLRNRRDLLRFLKARTRDHAAAEDLLQDLWMRLEHLAAGPIANIRAYLFRMAANMAVDRSRDTMRRSARDRRWGEGVYDIVSNPEAEPQIVDPAVLPEVQVLAQDELLQLQMALEALPQPLQQTFWLLKIEGREHSEVALLLGISQSAVEKRLAVAMRALREALLQRPG